MNMRQKKFVSEYMRDFNGVASVIRSGYPVKLANVQANKLLNNPEVKEEIDRQFAILSVECNITAKRVLNEVAKIAFLNPNTIFDESGEIIDLTLVKKLNISSEKVEHNGQTTITNKKTTVELYDKQKALDQLMRYLSLYNDKQEVTVKTIEEKKNELREKIKKVK